MDRDGTNAGYDLPLTAAVARVVSVPVIASGGAGRLEHMSEAVRAGADAVLCASILHYGHHTVREIKDQLTREGVAVRLDNSP
jgi:imidazole glycerol-phosphate synthase subunit HisF